MLTLKEQAWTQVELANSLKMSQSEISASLHRNNTAGLIDLQSKALYTSNLKDFITYGLCYVFPIEFGPPSLGLPTAFHHPNFLSKIAHSQAHYVWQDDQGKSFGQSIKPFHVNQALVAKLDTDMYELLAGIDLLRIGSGREKKIFDKVLDQYIKAYEQTVLPIHY